MWKNIKNLLIFAGVLAGLYFLLSFWGGIGKLLFSLYPFCDDTAYLQTPNSLRSHCYSWIDYSLLYLLIAIAVAIFTIIFLRTIKISLGKSAYLFSLIGLCFMLIGFILIGITPLIFFLGFILFISTPLFPWISKLFQRFSKSNQ